MTIRVDIIYDCTNYSIGGTTVEEVQTQVLSILESGKPGWLSVNHGEGRPQPCLLLITPSTQIAIMTPEEEP